MMRRAWCSGVRRASKCQWVEDEEVVEGSDPKEYPDPAGILVLLPRFLWHDSDGQHHRVTHGVLKTCRNQQRGHWYGAQVLVPNEQRFSHSSRMVEQISVLGRHGQSLPHNTMKPVCSDWFCMLNGFPGPAISGWFSARRNSHLIVRVEINVLAVKKSWCRHHVMNGMSKQLRWVRYE